MAIDVLRGRGSGDVVELQEPCNVIEDRTKLEGLIDCEGCECGDVSNLQISAVLKEYKANIKGMNVTLIDSVILETCKTCERPHITIPDMSGLISAVALSRVKINYKLSGKEIRFVRNAIGLSSKGLAKYLDVSIETVSRWENDKAPIGPTNEKLLRLTAGIALKDVTLGIEFDPREIMDMKIVSIIKPDRELDMAFQRVKISKDNRLQDAYFELKAA